MRPKHVFPLFAVALAVRLVYVAQIRDAPYFEVPLVDGASYMRTASAVAAGDLLAGDRVFWQAPLYSYFLALLLRLFGARMAAVYAVQAAVGALSCVLVYCIGRRLFDERAAVGAALVMAFYGPLVLFDAQPLVPVLHVVLTLAGLLLLLRAAGTAAGDRPPVRAGGGGILPWGTAGLFWGLSATATPNILLAVPAAALWGMRAARAEQGAGAVRRGALVAAFLLGVSAPVVAVTARNLLVAGEWVLISSNGGINFYIGNNPDYDRTIRIRPGGEFERLAQEPENLGIVAAGARSRWFAGRALAFLGGHPRAALGLYARKVLDLVAGREIPRNQEAYVYRGYSPLMALLLWRAGIAFPFGVIAPLALAGAIAGLGDAGRRGRGLLLLFAATYGGTILLFFPTDCYRLPLIPVAALFAGRLLRSPVAALRRPAVACALVAGLVLFNLDALRAAESWPEEEALNRAYALRAQGRLSGAREEYRRALALNPRRIDAHNALAAMAAQEGRWSEAAAHYRDLLEVAPDFAEVRRNLGQAYLALGRREEARREWEIAIHLAPGAAAALTDLCLWHLDERRAAAAAEYCARAVRARPDLPETHYAMGLVARALRRRDLALLELEEAARLYPAGSEGRRRAEAILEAMRRRAREGAGDE